MQYTYVIFCSNYVVTIKLNLYSIEGLTRNTACLLFRYCYEDLIL